MKLFWFTVCMIAVPIATFYAVYWSLPPEHARRNVWRCDASTRYRVSARPSLSDAHHAHRSGIAAVIAVNAVNIAYVVSAFREPEPEDGGVNWPAGLKRRPGAPPDKTD